MKSVSIIGVAGITFIAVANAELPLTMPVRVLACVIAGMLGGLLNSWRRHGRVALDTATAGFLGGLVGLGSHHWTHSDLTLGLIAIVVAGVIGFSGPGTYDKVRQFGPTLLDRITGRIDKDDNKKA